MDEEGSEAFLGALVFWWQHEYVNQRGYDEVYACDRDVILHYQSG